MPGQLCHTIAIGAGNTHALAVAGEGAPRFVDALGDVVAYRGRRFALNALAVGAAPLAYQWRFNETDIPNATGPVRALRE